MMISLYLGLRTKLKDSGLTEYHGDVLGLLILKGCHACGPGWVPLSQYKKDLQGLRVFLTGQHVQN